MLNLPVLLSAWTSASGQPPWPDVEYVYGWGIFGLPFESGHVLALRVFPHSSFGPYRTVWHRDPGGGWSIHVDGPEVDSACPRYYGAACDHTGRAHIALAWVDRVTLRITMDDPALEWTVTASQPPSLAVLNAAGARLPLASWRPTALLHAREVMARALGMGRLQLSGTMPSGHRGTLMPQRMFLVDKAQATWNDVDLGTYHPAARQPDHRRGGLASARCPGHGAGRVGSLAVSGHAESLNCGSPRLSVTSEREDLVRLDRPGGEFVHARSRSLFDEVLLGESASIETRTAAGDVASVPGEPPEHPGQGVVAVGGLLAGDGAVTASPIRKTVASTSSRLARATARRTALKVSSEP